MIRAITTNTTTSTIFFPSLRTPQEGMWFPDCESVVFRSKVSVVLPPIYQFARDTGITLQTFCSHTSVLLFFSRCKMFVFMHIWQDRTGQDRTGLPGGPFPARHQYGRIAGKIGTVLSTWGSTEQDSFPPPLPVFLKKCYYIEDLFPGRQKY